MTVKKGAEVEKNNRHELDGGNEKKANRIFFDSRFENFVSSAIWLRSFGLYLLGCNMSSVMSFFRSSSGFLVNLYKSLEKQKSLAVWERYRILIYQLKELANILECPI